MFCKYKYLQICSKLVKEACDIVEIKQDYQKVFFNDLNHQQILFQRIVNISELELSVATHKALEAHNIRYLWQLLLYTESFLKEKKSLNKKIIFELRSNVEKFGFFFGCTNLNDG